VKTFAIAKTVRKKGKLENLEKGFITPRKISPKNMRKKHFL